MTISLFIAFKSAVSLVMILSITRCIYRCFVQTHISFAEFSALSIARIWNYSSHRSGNLISPKIIAFNLFVQGVSWFKTMSRIIKMTFFFLSRLSKAFIHNINLSVNILVINLVNMLLLRFLKNPSNVVHISCLGIHPDLLDYFWVLMNYFII